MPNTIANEIASKGIQFRETLKASRKLALGTGAAAKDIRETRSHFHTVAVPRMYAARQQITRASRDMLNRCLHSKEIGTGMSEPR